MIILPFKVGVNTNPRELKRRRHRSVTEVTLLPLGRSSSSSTFFEKVACTTFLISLLFVLLIADTGKRF